MRIEKIPVDKIVPNKWNPNEMPEDMMEHLKKEFRRVGYLQPILVRPVKDKYEIIDGEHRWQASKDENVKEVEAVIVDMDDATAQVTSINMNKIKGETNPIKYAELLMELQDTIDKKLLCDMLAMSKQELEAYDLLTKLSKDTPLAQAGERLFETFSFSIEGSKNIKAVRRTLESIRTKTNAEKLLKLCEVYQNAKA